MSRRKSKYDKRHKRSVLHTGDARSRESERERAEIIEKELLGHSGSLTDAQLKRMAVKLRSNPSLATLGVAGILMMLLASSAYMNVSAPTAEAEGAVRRARLGHSPAKPNIVRDITREVPPSCAFAKDIVRATDIDRALDRVVIPYSFSRGICDKIAFKLSLPSNDRIMSAEAQAKITKALEKMNDDPELGKLFRFVSVEDKDYDFRGDDNNLLAFYINNAVREDGHLVSATSIAHNFPMRDAPLFAAAISVREDILSSQALEGIILHEIGHLLGLSHPSMDIVAAGGSIHDDTIMSVLSPECQRRVLDIWTGSHTDETMRLMEECGAEEGERFFSGSDVAAIGQQKAWCDRMLHSLGGKGYSV